MPRFTVTGPQDDASIMSTASATAHALPSKKPRRRRGRSFGGHVRIVIPENVKHQSAAERQLEQYQTRWNEIIEVFLLFVFIHIPLLLIPRRSTTSISNVLCFLLLMPRTCPRNYRGGIVSSTHSEPTGFTLMLHHSYDDLHRWRHRHRRVPRYRSGPLYGRTCGVASRVFHRRFRRLCCRHIRS